MPQPPGQPPFALSPFSPWRHAEEHDPWAELAAAGRNAAAAAERDAAARAAAAEAERVAEARAAARAAAAEAERVAEARFVAAAAAPAPPNATKLEDQAAFARAHQTLFYREAKYHLERISVANDIYSAGARQGRRGTITCGGLTRETS